MSTPRDICEVILQIVGVVPSDDTTGLVSNLLGLRSSAMFTAPEALPERWQQLGFLLEDSLGDPSGTEWKERVQAIMANRLEEHKPA